MLSIPRPRVALACVLIVGALVALHARPTFAAAPQRVHASFQPRSVTCSEAVAKGPNGVTSHSGDGVAPINICLHVEDAATGADLEGIPLEVRVTVGTVGMTGTAKYSGYLFSSSTGVAQISYRGDGTSFGGDTAVATSESGRAVAVAAIELTPPAGRYATRVVVLDALEQAIAASDARGESAYRSPSPGAPVAVQVRDAKGLGVDGHTLLATAEGARVAANPGFALSTSTACAGATPSLLLTTAATTVTPGGPTRPGTADLVICATTEEPPGAARVRVESVTDPLLPSAALTVPVATRPASIVARADGGAVVARVEGTGGIPAADGTPVRFSIAPTAGVVSSACVLSRGGAARVAVGLDLAEATVLVSADYARTGTPATCAAPGSERVETAVLVSPSTRASTPATGAAN